eukprot:gene171-63_t
MLPYEGDLPSWKNSRVRFNRVKPLLSKLENYTDGTKAQKAVPTLFSRVSQTPTKIYTPEVRVPWAGLQKVIHGEPGDPPMRSTETYDADLIPVTPVVGDRAIVQATLGLGSWSDGKLNQAAIKQALKKLKAPATDLRPNAQPATARESESPPAPPMAPAAQCYGQASASASASDSGVGVAASGVPVGSSGECPEPRQLVNP